VVVTLSVVALLYTTLNDSVELKDCPPLLVESARVSESYAVKRGMRLGSWAVALEPADVVDEEQEAVDVVVEVSELEEAEEAEEVEELLDDAVLEVVEAADD
jgi:hypothetical protein